MPFLCLPLAFHCLSTAFHWPSAVFPPPFLDFSRLSTASQVLQWMHTGQVTLTAAVFIGVLNLSSYLQIEALSQHCGRWIADSLDTTNVAEVRPETHTAFPCAPAATP